eukprot:349929-Chlamydomonas_euryale.AAC.23
MLRHALKAGQRFCRRASGLVRWHTLPHRRLGRRRRLRGAATIAGRAWECHFSCGIGRAKNLRSPRRMRQARCVVDDRLRRMRRLRAAHAGLQVVLLLAMQNRWWLKLCLWQRLLRMRLRLRHLWLQRWLRSRLRLQLYLRRLPACCYARS